MSKPSEHDDGPDALRRQIIGFGDRSLHKSYFPVLQERIAELEEARSALERQATALQATVSELQDARNEALESERRFRTLFNETTDGIVIADMQNRSLVLCNPALAKMMGATMEQMPLIDVDSIIAPEDRERAQQAFAKQATGEAPLARDMTMRRVDGSVFYADINAHAIELDGKTVLLGVVRDVTDRRAREAEIGRLNAVLEERVRERTAELETMIRELEAFSYSVSHDLRGPLRAVDGFSRILLEDYGQAVGEEGREYLERIAAAASRMAQMTDDLLSLSRVTREEMKSKNVDLSVIATDVLCDLARSDSERQVSVEVAPGAVVRGDPRLLRLMMENLLANAWKYTARKTKAVIEFGAIERDEWIECYVRDDGAGFDMAFVDKLFTPFQRLHRQDEYPGTGIGLATVQRVVQRHGGTIRAEGKVGHGATFSFTLRKGSPRPKR